MEARILAEFQAIVGGRGLISSPEELHTYECDGLTNFRVMPRAVLLPNSTDQVQAIVRICQRERIPFVARGSGTGLSGGALPVENGIVISLARMNRILDVDFPNARVVVEPGVINLDVTGRVSPQKRLCGLSRPALVRHRTAPHESPMRHSNGKSHLHGPSGLRLLQ